MLNAKGIKPIIFVMPEEATINYAELGQSFDRLDTNDVKILLKDGWEVGSHSLTHSNFNKLSETELRSEIIESKNKLEQELGIKINYFSYPKGNYNADTEAIVKEAGYKAVFTMDDGVVTQANAMYRIPRVGVDKTHSFSTFKQTFSPSNIKFRKFIKGLGISGL
jgi:peptidoglycan/xylan/chitin deacetylase (PgdA/CDA1 family)